MSSLLPTDALNRRRDRYASGNVAAAITRALRGQTGLSPTIETEAIRLLKTFVREVWPDPGPQTDLSRQVLYAHVAMLLCDMHPGCGATAAKVELIAQRVRNPQDGTPHSRPIRVQTDDYVYVADVAELYDVSLKDAMSIIIAEFREGRS